MIKNKRIAIYGLGVEGVASINYFGKQNSIEVFDEKNENEIEKSTINSITAKDVVYHFGKITSKTPGFDYIIHSAGIRPDNPRIKYLSAKNTKVLSATKYFFESTKAKIIGITGTKGKGTTSTLIYEFLKAANKDVILAGNIGTPMLEILPNVKKDSIVVLELSSFQLQDLQKSPHISVILMVTSEHLDWHKNLEEYINAKKNIIKYQNKNDFAIINQDFPSSKEFEKESPAKKYYFSTKSETNGVFVKDDYIKSNIKDSENICKIEDIKMPGRHNLQNICASICVAKIFNVKKEVIKNVIQTFGGLPNRLQLVSVVKGVKYYNDSFSTTPETTIAAIESFKNPKIIIIGGSSKKSDFTNLAKKILTDETIKKIILIGKEAKTIKKLISKPQIMSKILDNCPQNMTEIVSLAKSNAKSGDIILLSPACASFDMFKNYKDRGEQFTREVKKIAQH